MHITVTSLSDLELIAPPMRKNNVYAVFLIYTT